MTTLDILSDELSESGFFKLSDSCNTKSIIPTSESEKLNYELAKELGIALENKLFIKTIIDKALKKDDI